MKIRVAPWAAILLVLLGVIAVVVGVLLLSEPAGGAVLIGVGVLLAAWGGAYFGPLSYFVIDEEFIVVRWGFRRLHVALQPRDRLKIDREGNLLIQRRGQPEHLPVNRRYAHGGDWDRLAATLERNDGRLGQSGLS